MKKFIGIVLLIAMTVLSVGATTHSVLPKFEEQMTETQTTAANVKKNDLDMVYIGRFKVYGYDNCVQCCGKTDGITSSGTKATAGRTIAAPARFDFGDKLYIDGIGERIVEDRGGLGDNVLDAFCTNHNECYAVTGWYDVYRIEGGDDS